MLYAWGANSYGQLGLGYISEQELLPKPLDVVGPCSFVELTGGGGHTLAVTAGEDDARRLFVCGWNQSGQLGLRHNCDQASLIDTGVHGVKAASGGWDFSLVLLMDGRVLSAGSNRYQQLGRDTEDKWSNRFEEVPGLVNICQLSAGLRHAAAVDKDGRVFTWGSATKGQLGVQLGCKVKHSLPRLVDGVENISSVSCGQYFTLLKTRCGKLIGFGHNKFLQITDSHFEIASTPVNLPLSDVVSVRCGWTHAMAHHLNGRLSCWGRSNYGQCGTGEPTPTPIEPNLSHEVTDLRDVKKALAGSEHCLALVEQAGAVYSWGWNEHGNCGTGSTENVTAPTRVSFPSAIRVCDIFVGSAHSFAQSSV